MAIVGHGIDLVSIERIEGMLREHGDRFLQRCFTESEHREADEGNRKAEHLAGRFAAKEAVLKALGTGLTGGIAWTQIEVVRQASGQPALILSGAAATAAARIGARHWLISITHTQGLAQASVIAEGG